MEREREREKIRNKDKQRRVRKKINKQRKEKDSLGRRPPCTFYKTSSLSAQPWTSKNSLLVRENEKER